jgi:hypothetical protein
MPSLKARAPFAARRAQVIENPDLSGGVDLRRHPTLVAPNRAIHLHNVSLAEPGAWAVRAGYQAYSSNSLGGNRVQGGQRAYLASTQISVIAYDGAVHEVRDSGQINSTAVHSTISPTADVFFPYDRSIVAVLDGANRPYKSTDGIAWTRMGIDAPAGVSTLAQGGSSGSLLANIYEIGFSYKDRGTAHESNVGSTQRITLGSTGSIDAQIVNSSDAQVDAIVTYARNVTAGETVLRKYSSQAQGAGLSSTIVIDSSNWSANDEAPTNHNVPEGYAFAAVWKNRWWAKDGTVGNRLHFTELFQPQSWPSLFYIDIPFEKGDSIAAIQPLGDTLLVFGQSSIYLIIGQTSLDFEVRPSQGGETGAFGMRAVATVEQAAIHAGGDGINSFDGAGDRSLEHDIGPALADLVQNEGSADLELVASVYHHQRQEFRLSLPRVYPTGTRGEIVLNLDRTRENQGTPAWTTTDRDIAFYMLWNGNESAAGNRGRLFSINSTGGTVYEENVEAGANSSNLTAEYESPALSLGLHRARLTDAHVEYEPNGGALSIEVEADGIPYGPYTLNIGSGQATYDSTSVYDSAVYAGSGRRKAYQVLPLEAEGRTAKVKLTYTGTDRFRLFTFALGILPETGIRQVSE